MLQDEKPFLEYAKNRKQKTKGSPFTFMYVGNVGPLAGIDVLFDAFEKTELKNARLIIAGSGPAKEYLCRKAKHYSCTIEFWDVPTGKVPETQSMADVLLLPVKKGFAKYSVPSKLVAYMFSAKPIIASVDADSDTAECVRGSGAGWVAEPESVKSLGKCMEQAFYSSEDILRQKGGRGYDYAMDKFSKKENLEILSRICVDILNK